MATTWDIFLAHASPDKDRVRPIVTALRAAGKTVFFDEDSIPLGEDWDLFIPRAQRASRMTVACISPAYERAFYERAEVHDGIALSRNGGHRVVPLYLDGPPGPDDLLYGLKLKQGLVLPQRGLEDVVRQLLAALGEVAMAPVTPAPPQLELPDPASLLDALVRLTEASFDELVFRSGIPRASLLPKSVEQARRAINLIEHANEVPGDLEKLVALLRKIRPGIV